MLIASWNLFDFGASYRKGRQAEFRKQALSMINEDAERNAVTQAMDAWASVEESKGEYEAVREAAKASEMTFNAAKLKYAQGMASTFEYLSAQTTLTQARFEEMNALVKFKLAIENMKIGGLGGAQAASTGNTPGGKK
jgi:outer membrane protein TolC